MTYVSIWFLLGFLTALLTLWVTRDSPRLSLKEIGALLLVTVAGAISFTVACFILISELRDLLPDMEDVSIPHPFHRKEKK